MRPLKDVCGNGTGRLQKRSSTPLNYLGMSSSTGRLSGLCNGDAICASVHIARFVALSGPAPAHGCHPFTSSTGRVGARSDRHTVRVNAGWDICGSQGQLSCQARTMDFARNRRRAAHPTTAVCRPWPPELPAHWKQEQPLVTEELIATGRPVGIENPNTFYRQRMDSAFYHHIAE